MTDLSNRKDITSFATSMLADSRKRKDDQYRAFKNDRDRMASEARKRERKQLLMGYGAKALLNIGNSMVRTATQNFLNQEEILKNNIKFKSAVNGATERNNYRQAAAAFEGGETEFYRQLASKGMSNVFDKAVPSSYNETQRAQLLYNESVEAGKELQKLYNDSADQDNLLIQRIGKDGAEAYNKALVSERGTTLGSALFRKFKNLTRSDSPLDDSMTQSQDLLNIAGGVKAYGEIRRLGLDPYTSKQKAMEWVDASKNMAIGIADQKMINLKKPYIDSDTGDVKSLEESVMQVTLKNGDVKLVDINTGNSLTKSDLTYKDRKAKIIKKVPQNIIATQNAASLNLPQEDINVLGDVAKLMIGDSTDKERAEQATADIYAGIYITEKSLQEKGFKGKQSEVLAAKMHVINGKALIDDKFIGTGLNQEKNLLTDTDGYHPMIAYLAIKDIQENNPSSVMFSPQQEKLLLTDYALNINKYDSRLSPQSTKNLRTLIAERPEAALALEKTIKGETEELPVVPEPVAPEISNIAVINWKNSQTRQQKRKLERLSLDEIRSQYGTQIKASLAPKEVSATKNLRDWINSKSKSEAMKLRRKPMDTLLEEYKKELEDFAMSKNTFIKV